MRTRLTAVVAATGLVLGLSACSEDSEVCGFGEGLTLDPSDPDAFVEDLDALQEEAGDRLPSDLETVIAPFEGVDLSDPATLEDVRLGDFADAGRNVEDWVDQNC